MTKCDEIIARLMEQAFVNWARDVGRGLDPATATRAIDNAYATLVALPPDALSKVAAMNLSPDTQFFSDVRDELERARRKFPGNKHMLAATTEELGELAQALIDHSHGKQTAGQVYREAVQLAAMAVRIATEGDAGFIYSYERAQRDGANHE